MPVPLLVQLNRLSTRLTQFEKLDLGYKYPKNEWISSCKPDTKTHYPTLWMNNQEKDVMGIPEKGKATIKYRVVSRSVREDGDGKKRYSMDIEVQSFEPEGEMKPTSKAKAEMGVGGGGARLIQFAVDPRQRDPQGQFVGQSTGGADPVTMRQAYGQKGRSASLVPGAGAAALAGAGLLAGTQGGRRVLSKGLKAAGQGLHKVRSAVVMKNSGGRGAGFMTRTPGRPGLGEVIGKTLQRQRVRGD